MCLIFISFLKHPAYKLIVAGNRDEFYRRRTAPAGYWEDFPPVLAGRDLEAGGTWMGVTTSGRISMLTNYRDPLNINPSAPSRGEIVSDYLKSTVRPDNFLKQLENDGKKYNGFNLIVGNPEELWYYSNYKEGSDKLQPGFYGISNHLLDTPWPKIQRGKRRMEGALNRKEIDVEEVFDILYDDKVASDDQLPNTGLPLERERALSSMFIKTPDYGSRCSTIVLVDLEDRFLFSERVYDVSTFRYSTNTFRFSLKDH